MTPQHSLSCKFKTSISVGRDKDHVIVRFIGGYSHLRIVMSKNISPISVVISQISFHTLIIVIVFCLFYFSIKSGHSPSRLPHLLSIPGFSPAPPKLISSTVPTSSPHHPYTCSLQLVTPLS